MAALIAATLFSRPTPSGTTSLGKTTASRSGTSGRSPGKGFPCGSVFVVFVSGSVTSSFLPVIGRGVDLDRPWLHVVGLRHDELEDAVSELGLDLVRVDLHGKREAARELAVPPLLTQPTLVAGLCGLLDLTAEGDR